MADGVLIAPGMDKISVKNVTDGIWASVLEEQDAWWTWG